jgi:hypothetical protein
MLSYLLPRTLHYAARERRLLHGLQKAALVFQPADQGNGLTLMRWLFALSKLELVFFIANLVTLVVGVLLLFDIAGATLINWR